MAQHGVVRTDKMMGTQVAPYLLSGKYVVSEADTAIDNGMAVVIGDEIARDVYSLSTPAADSAKNKIGLVASSEWMDDERKQKLTEFYNEAGDIVRVYKLHEGDIFSVTADCLANATPEKGQIIELTAGTKWNNVNEATSKSTVIGKIIAKEIVDSLTYFVIQVD